MGLWLAKVNPGYYGAAQPEIWPSGDPTSAAGAMLNDRLGSLQGSLANVVRLVPFESDLQSPPRVIPVGV